VFAILCVLFCNRSAALVGALLFTVHPLQVEPVAWATGLKDLLGGFFSLLALWLYLKFSLLRRSECRGAQAYFALASGAYLLALLSKPSAVIVPLVALGLDYYLTHRVQTAPVASRADWWKRHAPLLGWILPALAMALAMRFFVQKVEKPDLLVPFWSRFFVAGDALAFYLGKLLYPLDLAIIYGRRPDVVLVHWWGYATWVLPAAALATAWLLRRRLPWLLAGLGIFFVAFLPVSGLVPFSFQSYSTVADRYAYPAMLGAAILLAGFTGELWNKKPLRWPAGVLLALLFATLVVQTRAQLLSWRDDQTLWTSLMRSRPGVWIAYNNLGSMALEAGQTQKALSLIAQALRLKPDEPRIQANMGNVMAAQKRWDEARRYYANALRLEPEMVYALVSLGNVLRAQNHRARAEEYYRRALALAPDAAPAHYNLGLLLAARGDNEQAIHEFQTALQSKADVETRNALALALARENRLDEAATHWRAALRLNPNYAEARINYGVLLAMQGRADAAIEQWQAALKLAPNNAELHHNLATLLMKQGEKTQAIAHWKEALRLKPDYPEARRALAAAMR
jgi:tetratricopeptide (TPR) repeat protein